MVVRIRLARWGARNHPFYGIVVANARAARDKKHLERVGTYNPVPDPSGVKHIEMNWERIKYWLGVGAQPSDRVAWLLSKAELMPPTPRQLQNEGRVSLTDQKTWDVRMVGPDGKVKMLSAEEARSMFEGKPEGEQLPKEVKAAAIKLPFKGSDIKLDGTPPTEALSPEERLKVLKMLVGIR
ncbi:hypothetical protein HDU97_001854 [Phlyctochytrium planicorne]|nr:hypothetical protein HDU97_001854 [Phlyctochytrium planicorne]